MTDRAEELLRAIAEGGLKYVRGFVITDEQVNQITEHLYSGKGTKVPTPERGMRPCIKQLTRCEIVREDGRRYEATNECAVEGLEECPRVTENCPTGEGYELCGSTHAEANAAKLAEESKDVPGEAFLYGHTWLCGPCQHALTAAGVTTFHITGEPA